MCSYMKVSVGVPLFNFCLQMLSQKRPRTNTCCLFVKEQRGEPAPVRKRLWKWNMTVKGVAVRFPRMQPNCGEMYYLHPFRTKFVFGCRRRIPDSPIQRGGKAVGMTGNTREFDV